MNQEVTKYKFKSVLQSLAQGVAAGVCIGIGTITNLISSNKYVGALLFSIGLYLVCCYQLKLCTGMAGYVLSSSSPVDLTVAAIGNVVGISFTYILAVLWNPLVRNMSEVVLFEKLDRQPYQIFISAIFCGMLMFLAVDRFKKSQHPVTKLLGIFLCIPCFVLNGFDHCVVNMFYVLSSESLQVGIFGLIMFGISMLGNFIGAIFAWVLFQKINFWNIKD